MLIIYFSSHAMQHLSLIAERKLAMHFPPTGESLQCNDLGHSAEPIQLLNHHYSTSFDTFDNT